MIDRLIRSEVCDNNPKHGAERGRTEFPWSLDGRAFPIALRKPCDRHPRVWSSRQFFRSQVFAATDN